MSLDPNAKESIPRTMLTDEKGNSAMFEYAAVTTVDINNQKVFRGVSYTWSRRFTVPSSAVGGGILDIVINPTCIPSEKLFVALPVSFIAFGAGPINVDIYFGTSSDEDGTLWLGTNRDFRIEEPACTKIRLSPTINDPGIKTPLEFMIPSDGVPAVASFGGQVEENLISIGRKDGKYMFRFTNTEANPASCLFSFDIFEATEGQ